MFLLNVRLTCAPADPGEPGGGASEGGGGAAGPVAGPQSGGEGLRGGGRPEDQRGAQVPLPAGAAEEEAGKPHGVARDPPVQQRRGGRDRKSHAAATGSESVSLQGSSDISKYHWEYWH